MSKSHRFQFTSAGSNVGSGVILWNQRQTDEHLLLIHTGASGDGKTELDGEDDAAWWNWGSNYRMPFRVEMEKLFSTEYTDGGVWTDDYNGSGVAGYVISGKAGTAYENNSIFLLAAGCGRENGIYGKNRIARYWTMSYSQAIAARCLDFDKDGVLHKSRLRYYGFTIRPIASWDYQGN